MPGENLDHNREVFVANLQPDGSITYTQITHTSLGTTGQVSISGNGTYVAFLSDQDPDASGPVTAPCMVIPRHQTLMKSSGK